MDWHSTNEAESSRAQYSPSILYSAFHLTKNFHYVSFIPDMFWVPTVYLTFHIWILWDTWQAVQAAYNHFSDGENAPGNCTAKVIDPLMLH